MKSQEIYNAVGITGKTGSGKTTIARKLGEITGFHVIHGDKFVHQMLQTTPIKQIAEWRLGQKLTLNPEEENLFKAGQLYEGGNMIFGCSKLKRFEALVALLGIDYLLSRELKELNGEPAIVELVGLPNLHTAKKLSDCSYLQGSELRYQKIAERDNISIKTAEELDKFYNSIINYKKLRYNRIFYNDYKTMPQGLEQYGEELVNRF